MPEHITQNLALHMSLQATSHQQELKKLNSRISELEMKLGDANGEVAELKMANQLLLDRIQQKCENQVAIVGQDRSRTEVKRSLSNYERGNEAGNYKTTSNYL